MAKAKSKAIVSVADGAGGLRQVHDRRFDPGEWPISFEVPKDKADTWFDYLRRECEKRGWNWTTFNQIEAQENSGSITITSNSGEYGELAVAWERKRDRPMKIRARSPATPEFPIDQAKGFFQHINERSAAGLTEEFLRHGQLCYDGLAWRGELGLDDKLRLGPPSKQDESALLGPRIILVSALVNGIDQWHATAAFQVLLREVAVFLTVVLGRNVRVSMGEGRTWTWIANSSGQAECELRNLGYVEKEWPNEMPAKGEMRQVPLAKVRRPDFSLRGFRGTQTEIDVPEDIVLLWQAVKKLKPDEHRQFLQVANIWHLAMSLDRQHQTGRFALMVVACEALKPQGAEYRDHNIYQVIEALLGSDTANLLQYNWFRAQAVRSAHLHSGEFRGSEFLLDAMMSSYQDPTFEEASRQLARIAEAAIIEWLRRGGTFAMAPLKRRKSGKRWVKEKALLLLPIIFCAGMALGWFLGWHSQ